MKSVMFRGSRGVQKPFRKGRGAVATALVAASGVAALAFAPSAQAASSYKVMLTKVPTGVVGVQLWDYTHDGTSEKVGCFKVQSGKEKDTGYKVSVKHFLTGYMYGNSTCSSDYKGLKDSATVKDNLSTTNFWFSLS